LFYYFRLLLLPKKPQLKFQVNGSVALRYEKEDPGTYTLVKLQKLIWNGLHNNPTLAIIVIFFVRRCSTTTQKEVSRCKFEINFPKYLP
jgi:hypothetical protein